MISANLVQNRVRLIHEVDLYTDIYGNLAFTANLNLHKLGVLHQTHGKFTPALVWLYSSVAWFIMPQISHIYKESLNLISCFPCCLTKNNWLQKHVFFVISPSAVPKLIVLGNILEILCNVIKRSFRLEVKANANTKLVTYLYQISAFIAYLLFKHFTDKIITNRKIRTKQL